MAGDPSVVEEGDRCFQNCLGELRGARKGPSRPGAFFGGRGACVHDLTFH